MIKKLRNQPCAQNREQAPKCGSNRKKKYVRLHQTFDEYRTFNKLQTGLSVGSTTDVTKRDEDVSISTIPNDRSGQTPCKEMIALILV
jgi:hypothetical protein